MKKALSFFLSVVCFLCLLPTLSACKKIGKVYSRYEITAEFSPDNRTVAGAVKIAFENVGDGEISVLKFQLYPNAYRKDVVYKPVSTAYAQSAYYDGESYGEIVISSVSGAKSWEIRGEEENVLYVYLLKSLYPGDKTVLDIGFITRLARVNHRTGIAERTVNLGNFFPILCGMKNGGFYETLYYNVGDPFYTDCAEFTLNLVVPKDYHLSSSGKIVDEKSLETKKAYTMYAMNVRDFAVSLSKSYQTLSKKVGETQLIYAYYADETPKETLALLEESFVYFEKTFGGYPYDVYTAAEISYCGSETVYPCLLLLSDRLNKEERIRAVVHGTAHQWWYAAVGSDQIENAWQDEGLAEYSSILFFENYEKYGLTRESMVTAALREYRSYYDVYGSVLGRTDTRMARHLKDFVGEYEYACLAYDKSAILFDTLRKSVGDKKFLNALKRYYENHLYQTVTSGALIGSFEKIGLDVHGFFDGFLSGKAIL